MFGRPRPAVSGSVLFAGEPSSSRSRPRRIWRARQRRIGRNPPPQAKGEYESDAVPRRRESPLRRLHQQKQQIHPPKRILLRLRVMSKLSRLIHRVARPRRRHEQPRLARVRALDVRQPLPARRKLSTVVR